MKKNRKAEILQLLRNSSDYVSGQELCDKLEISRTAVWKMIGQLREEGYVIDAVQNKGYYMVTLPEDVLSLSELESRIHNRWVGTNIFFKEETGSTNIDAKHLAEEGAPSGTVVVANLQNAGKGRRGKMWQSPAGTAAYFTILLRPDFAPDKASMLTLVMGLSVVDAIQSVYGMKAAIKWPNDIIVNDKKVCGILTEMNAELDYIQYVVIGTGINVNMDMIPEVIQETATSLFLESRKKHSRAELIQKVLEHFERYYDVFAKAQNMGPFLEKYNAHLVSLDKEVLVLDPKENFRGISQGINNKGELLIKKENGETVPVYAGEVSVRGLFGYV